MSLSIHPETAKLFQAVAGHLPQSLLLTGEKGVGLSTIARTFPGQLLATLVPQNTKGDPDEEAGVISVETVRRLYEQTRMKRTKTGIVLIDGADHMSSGAQAAFLKLLEEPNPHIHFILTAHDPQRLLPTIHSRVEKLVILPITSTQTEEFIVALGVKEAKKIMQLRFIAEGLPAELARLAENTDYFARKAAFVGDARTFLQESSYEKMRLIQKYKQEREDAVHLVDGAIRILRRSLSAKPQAAVISRLELLLDIREKLLMNFNASLQLTRFVL